MSTTLTLPTYACSCLNVKIFPKTLERSDRDRNIQSQSSNDTPPRAPPGWVTVSIDEKGVVIIQDQLMSKIRAEGGLQFVCRLCDTLVYRQVGGSESISSTHSGSTSNPNANAATAATASTGASIATAKDRTDYKNLFGRDWTSWIQIWTGQRGAISGKQLEKTLETASPVFGLVVPATSDTLTPSPTPPSSTLPLPSAASTNPPPVSGLSNSLLSANPSQHQPPKQPLLTLPDLFPPPPLTPSHPLFTNLARDAKKVSTAAREAAEAEIAKFIEAKRREIIEYEANLKKQVYTIWKAWKDSGHSEQLPSPSSASATDPISGVTDSRPTTKRHTSSNSTSSNASSRARTVIRTFEEKPTSPRPMQRPIQVNANASTPVAAPYSSSSPSLSPSNATPRVRQPISALATSLRQSGMHYPQRQPSPPLVGASEENFDMEFGETISGQGKPAVNQKASTSYTSSTPHASGNNAQSRHQKPKASAMKRVSIDTSKSVPVEISSDLSMEDSVQGDGGQPSKRKAVKFSSDKPDVVTVTREIESEKLQKLQEEQARGEEAIFDLEDGEGEESAAQIARKRGKPSAPTAAAAAAMVNEEGGIGPLESVPPTTAPEPESPRTKFSFPRLSQVGNGSAKNIEYTMAKSLPTASTLSNLANRSAGGVGSLGLDVDFKAEPLAVSTSRSAGSGRQPQQNGDGSASPFGGELRKIMASQTPSHRTSVLAERTRAAAAEGRYAKRNSPMPDDDNDEEGDKEDEHYDDDDEEDTEGSDDEEDEYKSDFVPSSSVAMAIPRLSNVVESKSQAAVAADNDFEGAMSKSVDPGPALELLAMEKKRPNRRSPDDDEGDEDEELEEERRRQRNEEEEDEMNDEEARDLMNRMIEGRGSLYAQRILSQTDRGVPASMWRSVA